MATDQEIRDAGFKYIPQQKYLLNPFELPVQGGGQDASTPSFGIPNTNAADNFSVYNPNPNSIVNKNYDPTRYTNLMEDSFLYGGSNATNQIFNPKSTTDLDLIRAQNLYNLSSNALAGGASKMNLDNIGMSMKGRSPGELEFLKKANNNFIQDNRQNYGAQGQYESDNYYDTVPSEFAYSSQTELDKFKDNYPEYFGLNQTGPKKGIPGLIEKYMTNSFLGKGLGMARDVLGNILPTNRRAMLENQLGASGVMVNDMGQIVQGKGSYDDASGRNVMAGYNANKLTAESFDKRIAMAKEKMSDKNKGARIAALEAAKADFLNAQGKADFIYDEEEENKKKKDTIISRLFTKKKETKAAADAQAAEDAQAAADAQAAVTMQTNNFVPPSGITGGGRAYDYSGRDNQYGTHDSTISNQQAQTNQDKGRGQQTSSAPTKSAPSRSSRHSSGPGGLHSNYAKGGRVYFFDGGRVAVMNGGLISIL